MNDTLQVPIAERMANVPESRRPGGIAASAIQIHVNINHASSHYASAIAASPRFETAVRYYRRGCPPLRQSSRSLHRQLASALRQRSSRRHSIIPGASGDSATAHSKSAATFSLDTDPGVTDHALLMGQYTGSPAVHRRCGLRWWDQRDSTAQHRRQLHQAESLGLFGWPLERG